MENLECLSKEIDFKEMDSILIGSFKVEKLHEGVLPLKD